VRAEQDKRVGKVGAPKAKQQVISCFILSRQVHCCPLLGIDAFTLGRFATFLQKF